MDAARSTCSPVISVIVPVYHVEKMLPQCLDSILGQTFGDFELILVNDGGNAQETAICEEYARKDPRIVYIAQENRGLSAARNAALDVCRGQYVMFVDSDDYVKSNFCERALQSVRDSGADMGIFDLVYLIDAKEVLHPSKLDAGVYSGYEILKRRIAGGDIQGYVWNKIYRAHLWDGIRFPVGEVWEDDAVLHEVIDRAKTVAIIHDVLYLKRKRSDSVTGLAGKDSSYTYWLFRQRTRRYEYILAHHPELKDVTVRDLAITITAYALNCLRRGDREGWQAARQWTDQYRLNTRHILPQIRLRYFTFRLGKYPFLAEDWCARTAKKLLGRTE